MDPKNNIFNGMNTTIGGNVFNGGSQQLNSQPQQQPMSSNQPFFGFSSEAETASGTDSTNTIPQMPQNQPNMQAAAEAAAIPAYQPKTGWEENNGGGVITPTQPITPIAPANPDKKQKKVKMPKAPATPEQTIKKFTVLSIVLGVAAVVCLFLGIWGLVDAVNTRTKLQSANSTLSTYSGIIKEIENQTGTTINMIEDLPVYVPASDYVYITGWNIKLKIPDTLTSVSYILNQNADYHSYICFAAMQKGVQYFPPFADINQNRDGVGCLYRIPVTDGEKDGNGNSYGQVVLTNGDYNYFYKEPSRLYSGSEADKGLETTARDLVKQMIADNISTY
ncbi:hypothetical protein IKG16_01165 [Candidatus Saccharibacteria bacterium]|nr:hypothetical protein [Candidatus Saccharibacteria bacterium]